jgi:hypothetical protein
MTKLQIDRNVWLEARRHNAAGEAENSRHNVEMERLQGEANAEQVRSHQQLEALQAQAQAETARHQREQEALSRFQTETSAALTKAQQDMDKVRNVMQNKSEWAKISNDSKRIAMQNALDKARTQTANLENMLTSDKIRHGLSKLELDRIRADIEKAKTDTTLAQEQFDWKKEVDDRELTIKEQRQKDQHLESSVKTFKTVYETITGIVKDLAVVAKATG